MINPIKPNLLFLAAGEGSRAKDITGDVPKSIYSLNQKDDCLLSLSLTQFLIKGGFSFEKIVIVGGYQFPMIEKRIGSIIQNLKISKFSIKIIDATPQWKKGPVFSFLSSKKTFDSLSSHSPILICPADTYFSTDFLQFVKNYVKQEIFDVSSPVAILFYFEDTLLDTHYPDAHTLEKQVIHLNKDSEKEVFSLKNLYSISKPVMAAKFIIPLLVINHDVFPIVETKVLEDEKSYNKLMKVLLACEKESKLSIKTIRYSSDSLLANIFWDCDFGSDLKQVVMHFNH